jgi:hypothetical protein
MTQSIVTHLTCIDGSANKFYDVITDPEPAGTFWVHAVSGGIGGHVTQRPLGSKGADAKGLTLDEAQALHASVVNKKTHQSPPYRVDASSKVVSITKSAPVTAKAAALRLPDHMLLKECETLPHLEALLANDDWWMQIKHDGIRGHFTVDHGQVSANSRGQKAPAIPTAIAKYLEQQFADSFVVLDAELVNDEGDVHLPVFDVLQVNDSPTWREHLPARVHWVEETFPEKTGPVRSTVTAKNEQAKRNLLNACWNLGCEGVVLKRRDRPYQGGRIDAALKYKFWNFANVVVIGPSASEHESVDIGLFDDTEPVGVRRDRKRYPLGADPKWGTLRRMASVSIRGKINPPAGSVIQIRYLYVKKRGGSTFETTLQRLAPEIKPKQCTIDQMRYKGEPRTTPFQY